MCKGTWSCNRKSVLLNQTTETRGLDGGIRKARRSGEHCEFRFCYNTREVCFKVGVMNKPQNHSSQKVAWDAPLNVMRHTALLQYQMLPWVVGWGGSNSTCTKPLVNCMQSNAQLARAFGSQAKHKLRTVRIETNAMCSVQCMAQGPNAHPLA